MITYASFISRGGLARMAMFALSISIACPPGQAAPENASIVAQDMAVRSSRIHWPVGLSPKQADLFAHNDILIRASCGKVWAHLVDAHQWPEWYANAKDVRMLRDDRPLHEGSGFAWHTFGIAVDSKVAEFVAGSRLGWFGAGPGMIAYHTWLLTDVRDGCRVVTEEVSSGSAAIAWRENDPGALHQGHALWLQKLKEISEK